MHLLLFGLKFMEYYQTNMSQQHKFVLNVFFSRCHLCSVHIFLQYYYDCSRVERRTHFTSVTNSYQPVHKIDMETTSSDE